MKHTDPDAQVRFPDTLVTPEFFNNLDADDTMAGQGDHFSQADVAAQEDFDLEALLVTSMKVVKYDSKIKEARKSLAYGGMAPAERAVIEAAVRKYELEKEWKAEANVIMFNAQYCTHCGGVHEHYVGDFQRQSHRTNAINRWIVANNDPSLFDEVKKTVESVGVCTDCYKKRGWNEAVAA